MSTHYVSGRVLNTSPGVLSHLIRHATQGGRKSIFGPTLPLSKLAQVT